MSKHINFSIKLVTHVIRSDGPQIEKIWSSIPTKSNMEGWNQKKKNQSHKQL